jgi:chaperonin cofactor prefoldin
LLRHEVDVLRSENRAKTDEIANLKEGIKQAMQQDNGTLSSHFGNLLENQTREVCRLKKIIEEYERRERVCQRKWTSLLQENLHLQEKVQAGAQQMIR